MMALLQAEASDPLWWEGFKPILDAIGGLPGVIGLITLVLVLLTLRFTKEMREAQKPCLEIDVQGDSPVQQRRRENVNGKRIHGNVHFRVTIFNRSTTANSITVVKAYEILSGGKLHEVRDALYDVDGKLLMHGRPKGSLDILGGRSQVLDYNGRDVRLTEWCKTYLFRVIVTDGHGNHWPGDAPPKGVIEKR